MQDVENSTLLADNPNQPREYRLGDLLNDWDTFAEEVYEARQTGQPLGVCTNITKVDQAIGGAFQPGLHSIQGGPGVGKTALALQIGATCGFPTTYVTCEMAPLELLRRITARATNTYLGKFKSGELAPDYSRQLARKAIATCPDLVILDCTRAYVGAFATTPGSNHMNIYDIANRNRNGSKHTLVIMDSLHSWSDKCPGAYSEYEALNTSLTHLGSLSVALKCPLIYIAERNRAGMDKGGLSAGAGTRKIEYSAECLIELDVKNKALDENDEKRISVELSKNRNGIIGRPIELCFNGALQRYREE